ncbi:HD-GYP domain-containing protein [Azospirillum argentinense]|uniref:HD-GYP domain-containing protein n=1 Tax=Azospirillum argentinense TaxID=2970906 RepID=UPI0020005654|nr:HD domain-containing phosphohydrolase [Azospirillum argentinense]
MWTRLRFEYGKGIPIDHVAISLEARIVAVADMFDAHTSERPYKGVWTNDAAAAFLQEQAGRKFDPNCVAALLADISAIEAIQQQFRDIPSGLLMPGRWRRSRSPLGRGLSITRL